MAFQIIRTTPSDKKLEKRYRVIDIARALGYTVGCVSNFVNQALQRKVANGCTLKEIVQFLDGPRREDPRSQPDMKAVREIQTRLLDEYGILIREESETSEE